jgi:hypothetical protein
MGKEAGPFFTYGPDGGNPEVKEQHQERYEREYLNMDLAFDGRFVQPLEPQDLRQRLLTELPKLYAAYQGYWQTLRNELEVVRKQCPHVYNELRYGAMRGFIDPL